MDWLKEILKKAGIEEEKVDSTIADINKELPKHFIPKDKYNEAAEAKKKLESDIQERDKQLEELKKAAGSNEELKKQIETLQADNKKTSEEWETKLAQMQKDFALERALTTAKAKNPKAVKALLDMEQIKLDGEQLLGLEDQLKSIRESDPYLFDNGKDPENVGGNTNPADAGDGDTNPWKADTFNLTQQAKLLQENPSLAARLKKEAGVKF